MPSTMGGGGFGSPGVEQSPTTEGRRVSLVVQL